MDKPIQDSYGKKLVKVGFAHYIDVTLAEKVDFIRLKPGQAGFNKDGIGYCVIVTFNGRPTPYYGSAALNLSFACKKEGKQRSLFDHEN